MCRVHLPIVALPTNTTHWSDTIESVITGRFPSPTHQDDGMSHFLLVQYYDGAQKEGDGSETAKQRIGVFV